ncbi:RHS repeat-associated core domain-containing protein, partial [Xanthomonas citri]
NLKNKNGQAYTFDYGNRLRDVTGKESYAYDAYGRRTVAGRPTTLTTQVYTQAGQLFYTEASGKGNTEYVYLNGSLLATRNAGTIKFQHTDALGSPIAVTDAAGQVVERTDYQPYGSPIGKTVDGIGYTGHAMDGATGLTYMQQRYYDQDLGRFLSVDPVAADSVFSANFNRYWYANNNPYRFTDPDGRDVKCDGVNCRVNSRNGYEFLALDAPKYTLITMQTAVLDSAIAYVNAIQAIAGSTQNSESSSEEGVATSNRPAGSDGKRGSTGGPGAGKRFPAESPEQKAAKEGVPCAYCGTPTTNTPGQPNSRERDHIDPKSRRGNNSPENERDSCRTCNREKSSRNPDEWESRGGR